jgi:hypothetical protein
MLVGLIALVAVSTNGMATTFNLGVLGVGNLAISNNVAGSGAPFSDWYFFSVAQDSSFQSIVASISFSGQGLASLSSVLYQDSGSGFLQVASSTDTNLGSDSWLSTLSYAPLLTSAPHQYRLDIFGATGASAPNGSYGGNIAVAPVPEPEIYAMMGIGLGLLGWVGRRKKVMERAAA